MKIAINAVSAKRGGAVTYLQNMLPVLQRHVMASGGGEVVVWRPDAVTADEHWPQEVEYREQRAATGGVRAVGGTFGRLWFDQLLLPRILRSERFDVLFSSANFGPLRTSSRHVLLVRNTVYFDEVYESRMRDPRVRARHLAQRWLVIRSMKAADVVLFPSKTMQAFVEPFFGGPRSNWRIAPYGTRHELLAPREGEPKAAVDRVRVLNVSLYADQKNFGSLLNGMLQLEARCPGRFQLVLTAGFHQEWLANSPYFPNYAAERGQFRRLAAGGAAEDVGWRRYGSLRDLYSSCDVFVFPSYVESFGHPLLEAMAAGLPVVAADAPCNREMCGDAAVYFAPFDARGCADAIESVATDRDLAYSLRQRGMLRAKQFSWDTHVRALFSAMCPN